MIVVDAGCVVIDGDVQAACVTVTLLPAIITLAVRAPPVLAATLNVTVPLPVPLAPEVIVIHPFVVELDQAQLPPALTVTDPVPPPVANVNDAGVAV